MKNEREKSERKLIDGITFQVGNPIVDKKGKLIGKIKAIQKNGIIIDRSNMNDEDLLIPYWICFNDGPNKLRTGISEKEVATKDWTTTKYQDCSSNHANL